MKLSDYPALIQTDNNPSDKVNGYLVFPRSESEWKKIDDFEGEGESYRRVLVNVEVDVLDPNSGVDNDNNTGLSQRVQAYVYLWAGGVDSLTLSLDREWDFGYFRDNRLGDWIDLFEGMEMVG